MSVHPVSQSSSFNVSNSNPTPNSIITRITTAVYHSFRMIGACFLSVLEPVINNLPERIKNWLDQKRIIVDLILDIPQGQKQAVLEQLLGIIFPNITAEKKAKLIQIANDPQNPKKLLSSIRYDTYNSAAINTLIMMETLGIAKDQRADVLAYVLPLDTFDLYMAKNGYQCDDELLIYNFSDTYNLIKAIAAIAKNERNDVMSYAQQLFDPEVFQGSGKTSIIRSITNLPAQQRQAIFEIAKGFCHKEPQRLFVANQEYSFSFCYNPSEATKAQIIDLIAKTPIDETRNIIASFQPLFGSNTINGWDKALMLQALAAISEEERRRVMGYLACLFPSTEGPTLSNPALITAMAAVSEEERANVMRFFKPLFNPTHQISQPYLLKTIATIPQEERENVMRHAADLVNSKSDGWDNSSIIKSIAIRRSDTERAAYVQAFKQGFHSEEERDEFFHSSSQNLPSGAAVSAAAAPVKA